jgi:hypothetical protein
LRRPKARGEARAREEITRSFCSSPGSSTFPARSRSLEMPARCRRSDSPPVYPGSPQVQRRAAPASGSVAGSLQCPSATRIPRASIGARQHRQHSEATKTFEAIGGALRAVQTALTKSKLDASPCSSPCEDLESLCGTECTESTACSSSLSEDGCTDSRRVSLRDARRSLKERICTEERSVRFTRGLLAKLDELRDAVGEEHSQMA